MSQPSDAQSLFAEFLAERESESALDFAAWCDARSEFAHAPEMRRKVERIHAAWRALVGDLERVEGGGRRASSDREVVRV